MAVLVYLIVVSGLCIVLSEGLGVLLDWLITYYYKYPQPEVIIQEVVVMNPEAFPACLLLFSTKSFLLG